MLDLGISQLGRGRIQLRKKSSCFRQHTPEIRQQKVATEDSHTEEELQISIRGVIVDPFFVTAAGVGGIAGVEMLGLEEFVASSLHSASYILRGIIINKRLESLHFLGLEYLGGDLPADEGMQAELLDLFVGEGVGLPSSQDLFFLLSR